MTDKIEQEAELNNIITPPAHDTTTPSKKKSNKMEYANATITGQLFISQGVTDSFRRDPKVQAKYFPFGYTKDKITTFCEVQAAAALAYSRQKSEAGDKVGSLDRFEKNYAAAKTELSCLIKLIKIVIKNDKDRAKTLELHGKKSSVPAAVLTYMEHFYNTILQDNDLINLLSVYGYDEKRVSICQSSYRIALDSYNEYQKDFKDSKDATKEKDDKMEELNKWMYEYYTVEKVASMLKIDKIEEQVC